MKSSHFLFFGLVIFSACSSNKPPELTDKLKADISERIHANVKNPSSYQSLEWTEIDTLFDTIDKDGEYKKMQAIYDSLDKITTRSLSDGITDDLNNYAIYDSAMRTKTEILDRMHHWVINMPKEPVGWFVEHKFKATDSTGLPAIYTYDIRFDKDMNIKGIEDITSLKNK